MIVDYFKGIWKDRYILTSFVNRDLQAKYRRSVLGIAWSILTPLGLVLMIGGVYSIIFGAPPTEFIPFLFSGLTPWFFISGVSDSGTSSFLNAEGYLKQTTVNAQVFPLRVCLGGFINLLYSVIAFFAVYLFMKPNQFGPIMLMTFIGLIIMFLFVLAITNFSAVLNLNMRDFQPLQALIMQGLFYATPIIFPAEMLKEKGYEMIYILNPFYYILEVVRQPMLGNLPSINVYILATVISVSLFIFSVIAVMRAKKGIAFKL